MVHLCNLEQLCLIIPITGSQGSHFSLSFLISRGPDHSCSLGHHDVSYMPHYLLFLVPIRFPLMIYPSFLHPLGPVTTIYSVWVHSHYNVLGCTP
jgi:hypothetical protein